MPNIISCQTRIRTFHPMWAEPGSAKQKMTTKIRAMKMQGGVSKNEMGWANFNARLETEELDVILPNDYIEITDLVTWLTT